MPMNGVVFEYWKDGDEANKHEAPATANITVNGIDYEGAFVIRGLENGETYWMKEKSTIAGFDVSDELFTFSVSEDGYINGYDIYVMTAMNYKQDRRCDIEIKKVDYENQSVDLVGAEFVIYEWDELTGMYNTWPSDYSISYDAATKSYKGYVYWTERNLGKFKIVETVPPVGYMVDWESEFQFDRNETDAHRTVVYAKDAEHDSTIGTTKYLDITTDGVTDAAQNKHTEIYTVLVDAQTQTHAGVAGRTEVLEDTISYAYANPGYTYKVWGVLVDAVTGQRLKDASNKDIKSQEVTFTPTASSGTVPEKLVYTLDSSAFVNKTIVAYTYMTYATGEMIVYEEDRTDEDEIIRYPKFSTYAVDNETGDKEGVYGDSSTIRDVVTFKNLVKDQQYVLEARVAYKGNDTTIYTQTGEAVVMTAGDLMPLVWQDDDRQTDHNGLKYEEYYTFTAGSNTTWEETMLIELDTWDVDDSDYVVYERLYVEDEDGNLVLLSSEVDYENADQTLNYVNNRHLKVTKHIENKYETFGEATFIFKLTGTSRRGQYVERTKMVTVNGTSADDDVTFEWDDIPVGIYELHEEVVSRYHVSDIEGISGKVTKVEDGVTTMKYYAVVDLSREDAEVKFSNRFEQYEKDSHNSSVVNHIDGLTYTVTFDLQGGTYSGNAADLLQHINSGRKPSVPQGTVEKSGFTFEGWYYNDSHGNSHRYGFGKVVGDITVYAKWTAVTPPANPGQ
jgi:hypothetical protein